MIALLICCSLQVWSGSAGGNCTEHDEDDVGGVGGEGGAGGESGSESNGEDHCHDGETQELAEDVSWSA